MGGELKLIVAGCVYKVPSDCSSEIERSEALPLNRCVRDADDPGWNVAVVSPVPICTVVEPAVATTRTVVWAVCPPTVAVDGDSPQTRIGCSAQCNSRRNRCCPLLPASTRQTRRSRAVK